MPNYRNTSAVGQDLASSRMILIQHDSNYALTGDPIVVPVIETSDIVNSVATISKEDEEGVTYQADGATTITKNFTVMQKDLNAIRLPRLLGDNTYAWVKEMSRKADPNGDYIYEYGVGAKISKNTTIGGKTGSIPLTLNITPNSAQVTFAVASFDNSIFLGDLANAGTETLAAGYGYDHFAVSAV